MIDWLATRGVKGGLMPLTPYASALHANIRAACQALDLRLLRFERPSEIESIVHPLLTVVDDIAAACEVARSLGERVLLTTGSKDLPVTSTPCLRSCCWRGCCRHRQCWPSARRSVWVEQIIAMKGPFDAELNRALSIAPVAAIWSLPRSQAPKGVSGEGAPLSLSWASPASSFAALIPNMIHGGERSSLPRML